MGGTIALLLFVVGVPAIMAFASCSSWDDGYRRGWHDHKTGEWAEDVKRRPQDYD